ncbi:hypothetical protein HPB47_027961 [Ixodes persulcatus]|uniref:Uncharacterized protein n=1 Tax=Ixodes persulcatus TaxID=34615 RepID=A0AC60PUR7_IXOPE|nr:hypothetical protein HPB47_027961 [Ixodes persulcatus]
MWKIPDAYRQAARAMYMRVVALENPSVTVLSYNPGLSRPTWVPRMDQARLGSRSGRSSWQKSQQRRWLKLSFIYIPSAAGKVVPKVSILLGWMLTFSFQRNKWKTLVPKDGDKCLPLVPVLALPLILYCVTNQPVTLSWYDGPSGEILTQYFMLQSPDIREHEECLKLVEKNHLDVNSNIDGLGLSIFMAACLSKKEAVVRRMLQNGADVKARSRSGDSPLYLATYRKLTTDDCDDTGLLKHLIGLVTVHDGAGLEEDFESSRKVSPGANTFVESGVSKPRPAGLTRASEVFRTARGPLRADPLLPALKGNQHQVLEAINALKDSLDRLYEEHTRHREEYREASLNCGEKWLLDSKLIVNLKLHRSFRDLKA